MLKVAQGRAVPVRGTGVVEANVGCSHVEIICQLHSHHVPPGVDANGGVGGVYLPNRSLRRTIPAALTLALALALALASISTPLRLAHRTCSGMVGHI